MFKSVQPMSLGDTALRLARFFSMSAEFWINLQAMHDLTEARMQNGVAGAAVKR